MLLHQTGGLGVPVPDMAPDKCGLDTIRSHGIPSGCMQTQGDGLSLSERSAILSEYEEMESHA